jgi:hypothetical protein
LSVRLEELFGAWKKWDAPSSFGLWRLHTMHSWSLQFLILYWLYIFSPSLWTLNKVWPFNLTTSQLGRP